MDNKNADRINPIGIFNGVHGAIRTPDARFRNLLESLLQPLMIADKPLQFQP